MARSQAAKPPLETVLTAARVARERGDLGTARRAFLHLCVRLGEARELQTQTALEGERLAKELAIRGAHLAALEASLCAHQLGRDQRGPLEKLAERYPRWRPTPGPIGVAKDALLAGASGLFRVGIRQQARIVSLSGGITGAGTEAFRRVLNLAHVDLDWLLLDVADLSYVGSSGLAIVVKSAEELRAAGGGVAMFGPSSNLKLLVETLGLGDSLHPVASLSEALQLSLRG